MPKLLRIVRTKISSEIPKETSIWLHTLGRVPLSTAVTHRKPEPDWEQISLHIPCWRKDGELSFFSQVTAGEQVFSALGWNGLSGKKKRRKKRARG